MTRIVLCRPAGAVRFRVARAGRGRRRPAAMPAPSRERAARRNARAHRGHAAAPRRGRPGRCRRASSPRRRPAQRAANLSYGVGGAAALGDRPGLHAQPVHQEERAAVVVGNGHRVLPAQGATSTWSSRSPTRTCRRPTATGWARGTTPISTPTTSVRRPAHVGRRRLVRLALDVHTSGSACTTAPASASPSSRATSSAPATGRSAPRRTPATSTSATRSA